MSFDNIHAHFLNNHIELSEADILEMKEHSQSAEINNVIVGLDEYCIGVSFLSEDKGLKYSLFYLNGKNQLQGNLIQLDSEMKNRDELVLYFCHYLSDKYDSVDLVNTYNTFQKHSRSLHENFGYHTIVSSEIAKYAGKEMAIFAKGVKGIYIFKALNKSEFYCAFFGKKRIPYEIKESSFVYLMLNKRNDFIKIGRSKNPSFREKTLQAEDPHVELITFWEAPPVLERQLHELLKAKRQRGEWFDLNFNDMKLIKEFMCKY